MYKKIILIVIVSIITISQFFFAENYIRNYYVKKITYLESKKLTNFQIRKKIFESFFEKNLLAKYFRFSYIKEKDFNKKNYKNSKKNGRYDIVFIDNEKLTIRFFLPKDTLKLCIVIEKSFKINKIKIFSSSSKIERQINRISRLLYTINQIIIQDDKLLSLSFTVLDEYAIKVMTIDIKKKIEKQISEQTTESIDMYYNMLQDHLKKLNPSKTSYYNKFIIDEFKSSYKKFIKKVKERKLPININDIDDLLLSIVKSKNDARYKDTVNIRIVTSELKKYYNKFYFSYTKLRENLKDEIVSSKSNNKIWIKVNIYTQLFQIILIFLIAISSITFNSKTKSLKERLKIKK